MYDADGWDSYAAYAHEQMLELMFKESDDCIEFVNKWIQDQLATAVPTEVFQEIEQ